MLLLSLLSNLHFLFQLSILFYYLEILFTSEWDNTFFSYLYSISVSVELHFWLSLSSSMIAVHWSEVSFLPVTIKSLSWSVCSSENLDFMSIFPYFSSCGLQAFLLLLERDTVLICYFDCINQGSKMMP